MSELIDDETMSLFSNNGTAYDLHGPSQAPVLVLIHGLGLCRHIWDDYIPELTPHYRVLSYDLYGHGNSAPLAEKASLTLYSEQLVSLLDYLKIEKAVIIGFSIGGMINRRFAIDHGNRTSALLILNSPHDRGLEGQKLVEQRAKTVAQEGALATMDTALKRWFTPAFHVDHPQILEQVVEWRVKADADSYTQAAWVLAAGVKELIQDKLPITIPTLVLTCEHDSGSTPAMSESIAAQIVGAEIQVVPRLQHLGLLEEPELFISVILDFLNRIKAAL